MVPWGRPHLGRWWDGSERNSTGGFGYPKSRGTCSVLMLTRRSHGSSLLPLVLTAILAATALSAVAALASPQQALGASTFTAKCDANLRTQALIEVHQEGRAARRRPDVRGHDGERRQLEPRLQRSTRTRATAGTRSATSTAAAPRSATACRTSTRQPRCSRRTRSTRSTRSATACRCAQAQARRRPRRPRCPKGASVLVVSRVTGSSWSTDCAGDTDVRHVLVPDRLRVRQERPVPLRRDLRLRGHIPVRRRDDKRPGPAIRRRRRSRHHHRPVSRGSTSATGRARSTGPRSARPARSSPTSRRPSTPASSTTSTRRIDRAPRPRA